MPGGNSGHAEEDRALRSQVQAWISQLLGCSLVLFPPALDRVAACSCPGAPAQALRLVLSTPRGAEGPPEDLLSEGRDLVTNCSL